VVSGPAALCRLSGRTVDGLGGNSGGIVGLATNLKELGVPDTTIQCILRHENVNATQRFYIETPSAVAVDAMKKSEDKISGTAAVQ
jgi:hypothetical protein